MNISLQPAYVLHRRPYRETSALVDFFTPEYGRLIAVAKGVRKARSLQQGLLQPFVPLLISWVGKGELVTLTQVERAPIAPQYKIKPLYGTCLFAGFYLNELLISLLQKFDAHPGLYHRYEMTLLALQTPVLEQKVLRLFEKHLLEELGYGLLPTSEPMLQRTFAAEKYYQFTFENGFIINEIENYPEVETHVFSGKSLMALANEQWPDAESLQDAKRLLRSVLMTLLGRRRLHSRRLFVGY
ncbi:MAG TPA: DNA repair protein RecO [Gammaproteobacteria bacterium]|jgi:DNA repair protein RecO (recombination protein O)|nr:DNA repair protein RecO [Gammaproteobacteria bacterium]